MTAPLGEHTQSGRYERIRRASLCVILVEAGMTGKGIDGSNESLPWRNAPRKPFT